MTNYQRFLEQLDRESWWRVAVRQCLAQHPRVYNGLGLCTECRARDCSCGSCPKCKAKGWDWNDHPNGGKHNAKFLATLDN